MNDNVWQLNDSKFKALNNILFVNSYNSYFVKNNKQYNNWMTIEWQWMTMNDNEWQWMTMNDNEWQFNNLTKLIIFA